MVSTHLMGKILFISYSIEGVFLKSSFIKDCPVPFWGGIGISFFDSRSTIAMKSS